MRRRIRVFGPKLGPGNAVRVGCLLLAWFVTCPFAASQVTVFNPQGLAVPADRAQLLLRLSCKMAAQELHAHHAETEFPLTLVIGKNPGLYTMDDTHQIYTVYLQEWKESDFTKATLMIAMRRLMVPKTGKMISEVLRRAHLIEPVGVLELRTQKGKPDHQDQ